MKDTNLSTCYNHVMYSISERISVSIDIKNNIYNLDLDSLFLMAERKNKKRGFLFVSKVLGKHIPCQPSQSLAMGNLLGLMYYEKTFHTQSNLLEEVLDAIKKENTSLISQKIIQKRISLPEKILFIGFAETATALGHAVFDIFKEKASYIHTTRENLEDEIKSINFEEEHSHATSHRVYPLYCQELESFCPIVFIDDEITTGKTILNCIESIQKKYPRKSYTILSLLDWRSDEQKVYFQKKEIELGIQINLISLVSGEIKVIHSDSISYKEPPEINHETKENQEINVYFMDSFFQEHEKIKNQFYLRHTGRFGIHSSMQNTLDNSIHKASVFLKTLRKGRHLLCLGTEEFMYIPMRLAALLGENVLYQSTTRSPIYPINKDQYGAKNACSFESPNHKNIENFLYNIPQNFYDDLFLFIENEIPYSNLKSLLQSISYKNFKNITIFFFTGTNTMLQEPSSLGSYIKNDVCFILKEINNIQEKSTEEREKAIQSGIHYSEMLPMEKIPHAKYQNLFNKSLEKYGKKIALATLTVAEKIKAYKGQEVILVSLARAGTPIGILIKKYFKLKYNLDIIHYSISIIRGKGFDENAIRYILSKHPQKKIQFIDAWTGKGSIAKVLKDSCDTFKEKWGISIDHHLAVLADPGGCATLFGTRDDFFIPNSCLNSTVSGLISRTVHQRTMKEYDYHGAKYYRELKEHDVSYLFINSIANYFEELKEIPTPEFLLENPPWSGWEEVKEIQKTFHIKDIHFIKPGIGETTRILLRRMPWKILISGDFEELEPLLLLAHEKNICVEKYPLKNYKCCGLILSLGDT